jgi:GTP 3',8-cyclase
VSDRRSRPLRDLRISVTDRCNLRCTYCMPKEVFGREFEFLPREQLLTFEEIVRVARAFARHGVSKIRLTGGEPLVRHDIERLVAMLADIDEISDVALTTNGSALSAKAEALKLAGLTRVTVSLDALDDETFGAMNDVAFPVARVLAGIDAALRPGSRRSTWSSNDASTTTPLPGWPSASAAPGTRCPTSAADEGSAINPAFQIGCRRAGDG